MNFFPQWCYSCGCFLKLPTKSGICVSCFPKLPWWNEEICGNCLEPKLYCASCKKEPPVYPIFAYREPVITWIISFKYNKNFYAARIFQKIIHCWLRQYTSFLENYDFIFPLPAHPYRFLRRGFNSSQYLVKNLDKKKVNTDLATRILWTKPQTTLPYRQRIQLLKKKVFSVSSEVKGKRILIFDDVVTTKSTVLNFANQIKRKKASAVDILCLARIL